MNAATMTMAEKLAFVKAAASQIDADDNEVFEAFDAAECALEDEADNAVELFETFLDVLIRRGITIDTRPGKPAYTKQELRWMKRPLSNRGKFTPEPSRK